MTQAGFFYNRPLYVLLKLRKHYGDCFSMREPAYLGREWWVWVCDPTAIRELLSAGPSVACPGLQEEPVAAAAADAAAPALDSAQCAAAAATATRRHIERWPRERPFRLMSPLRRIVVESLFEAFTGVTDAAHVAAIDAALRRVRRWDLVLYPNVLHGDGRPRARRRLEWEQETIASVLATARPDRPRRGWVSAAVALAHVSELATLVLAWALEQLVRQEGALEALRRDLEQGAQDYLDAVLAATVWARPPVLSVGRRLLVDHSCCGYAIPAGTMVRLAVGVAHYGREIDARPEYVRPESFFGMRPEEVSEFALGHGQTRALGDLAVAVSRAVLREISLQVDLERALEPPELSRFQRPTYTIRPNSSTRAIISSRARRPARDLVAATA